jgi:hypothetical protein
MSERKCLTGPEVLGAKDFKLEWVDVPEWGGDGAGLYVRTISGTERDTFETEGLSLKKGTLQREAVETTRARLVALCAADADGKRLFQPSDVQGLSRKWAKPLDRVYEAAATLNGIRKEDVEELRGNYATPPNGASGLS